ncbi:MAG: phage holin family protein [Synechococcus sp.]|nr:phage holin family protein [Synechococcus sp.]
MTDSQRPRGFGAATRITALAASVMDLHVRMALQEVDREKRRLISGGLFLAIGGTSMLLALLAAEVALLLWLQQQFNLSMLQALLALATANLVLAGISLRIGGQVLKGPFLPQTLDGLSRTVRAVLGRD